MTFSIALNRAFVERVYEYGSIQRAVKFISENCVPEDVFSEDKLLDWALNSGLDLTVPEPEEGA